MRESIVEKEISNRGKKARRSCSWNLFHRDLMECLIV